MKKIVLAIAVVSFCLSNIPTALTAAQEIKPRARASAWTPLGPQGGQIRGLARNSRSPNELYAAAYAGQFYRSTTNGANWIRTATLNNTYLYDVAVDPKTPTTVYVLGELNLFKSEDRGETFAELPFGSGMSADSGRMAIDPTDAGTIYVAGRVYSDQKYRMAVLKTVDGGKKWIAKKFEAGSFGTVGRDIAVSAKNPATIYYCGDYYDGSGTQARLYRSTDSGGTWKNVTPGFLKGASSSATALVLDSKTPETIFLCCSGVGWSGVARSSDSGASWVKQTTPAWLQAYAVASDSGKSGALYAGGINVDNQDACFKSVDGGATWTEKRSGLDGQALDILASGAMVHVASTVGIFRSANGGAAFKAGYVGIKSTLIDNFDFVPPASGAGDGAAGTIFTMAFGCGFFKSQDAGGHWTRLGANPEGQTTSLIVPAGDPNRIYLAVYGSGVLRSANGGKSFDRVLSGNAGLYLAADPADKDWVLAAGSVLVGGRSVMGVYRSTDGGLKWTKTKIRDDANSYATAVALDPSNRNTVYVAGWTASYIPVFYKSTNGGAAWTPIASPSSSSGFRFASIAVAPDSPTTVYTNSGNSLQEIYKSTNGGFSWTRLVNGPSYTRWVAVNPSDSNEVLAAGSGVFYSGDGGSSWKDLSPGLPVDYTRFSMTCVAIDSAGRNVYVGTWGGGICRRSF
jgi:photosystem II stability/assembly factor-like uncharacterized protein